MNPMRTPQASRNILLAVTGLNPQIVTETLYALAVKRAGGPIPDEIHVLTTSEGAERVRLTLLSKEPGWFYRLCRDYQLPPIQFGVESIHVIAGSAGPLEDIRTPQENEQMADFVAEKLRYFTRDPDSALHVSIAGGRKTMGFYLGYALSLYGRKQDRLSHVLVSAPYENNRDFFYPTPEEHVITAADPKQRPLDAAKAEVTLAEIPFVRLRANLPQRMREETFSFSEVVSAAQAWERPPLLELNLAEGSIVAGGEVVKLSDTEFAVYSWLAQRVVQGLPPIHPDADEKHLAAKDFIAHYASYANEMSGRFAHTKKTLNCGGMEQNYLSGRKTQINKKLRNALGETTAEPYLIQAFGERLKTSYGLGLKSEAVVVKRF